MANLRKKVQQSGMALHALDLLKPSVSDTRKKSNLIGLMIREGSIALVHIDKTVFKKTDKEKIIVANKRKMHNAALRELGLNPKKILNHSPISS